MKIYLARTFLLCLTLFSACDPFKIIYLKVNENLNFNVTSNCGNVHVWASALKHPKDTEAYNTIYLHIKSNNLNSFSINNDKLQFIGQNGIVSSSKKKQIINSKEIIYSFNTQSELALTKSIIKIPPCDIITCEGTSLITDTLYIEND